MEVEVGRGSVGLLGNRRRTYQDLVGHELILETAQVADAADVGVHYRAFIDTVALFVLDDYCEVRLACCSGHSCVVDK